MYLVNTRSGSGIKPESSCAAVALYISSSAEVCLLCLGSLSKENIDAIEHVQKFALKVGQKDWHSDYDTLLNSANVPPLAARRKALKLCQLSSIVQGHSEFPDLPTSKRASPYLRSTNSAHTDTTFHSHYPTSKLFFPLLD